MCRDVTLWEHYSAAWIFYFVLHLFFMFFSNQRKPHKSITRIISRGVCKEKTHPPNPPNRAAWYQEYRPMKAATAAYKAESRAVCSSTWQTDSATSGQQAKEYPLLEGWENIDLSDIQFFKRKCKGEFF